MRSTQGREGLVDIASGEEMAKACLNSQERRRLIGRDQVEFVSGKISVSRMETVTAGRAWGLIDLVKEITRGREPEGVVR